MGKRNPYVTTIGFNKDIPEHVQVAEFLNSIGRGKANYIVRAVLCYQNSSQNIQMEESGMNATIQVQYGDVRRMVMQILEEQGIGKQYIPKDIIKKKTEDKLEETKVNDFDVETLEGIMASLAAFKG